MSDTRRAAAYCMTRNLYAQAIPSMKSLLFHTHVDRLYVLAEDNHLPYWTPDCVKVINVSGQQFFRPGGPNYHTKWTWMVLMRAALPLVLTEESQVLSLDVDTIVREDIGDLWDTDLSGYYLAGVDEPAKTKEFGYPYINMGSVMFNLSMLRNGKSQEIIDSLNTEKYAFNEQDCINELCHEHVKLLPERYNANNWTITRHGSLECATIRHYAADNFWDGRPEVKEWMEREWKVKS